MLIQLHIENLAIINNLDISFNNGLNILFMVSQNLFKLFY